MFLSQTLGLIYPQTNKQKTNKQTNKQTNEQKKPTDSTFRSLSKGQFREKKMIFW